jgi:protein transport protein SEC24
MNTYNPPPTNAYNPRPTNAYNTPPTNTYNQKHTQSYGDHNITGYQVPPAQHYQRPPPQQKQYQPSGNQRAKSPQSGNIRSTKMSTKNRRPRSQSPVKSDLIDPKSVPQLDASKTLYETRYKTSSSELPPCATASYLCEDDGNASPRYIRMTTNAIPCSGDISDRAGLVIGAVVQPFATIPEEEKTENIITYSPVRCSTCNAYVNAHTTWLKKGRKFKCNLCFEENETPEYVIDYNGQQQPYRCYLDNYRNRVDKQSRPELRHGTVEYLAPTEFLKTDDNGQAMQVKPSFLFVLDVSYGAFNNGLLKSLIATIRDILEELREDLDAWGTLLFGAVTYDNTLHFHDYKSGRVMRVCDVDNPFLPIPGSELLFELRDDVNYTLFLKFLEGLPELFQDNQKLPKQQHCVGAAMQIALDALSETGGKVILFQTGISSVGIGSVKNRFDPKLVGSKEETKLFRGAVAFYNDLACKAVEEKKITVGFDLFLCTGTHVDLASIAEVTRATGGQVYFYDNYQDVIDSTKLFYDLRQNIMRFTGFDAIMAVRASKGLEIMEQMGALTETPGKEILLPVVTSDSTFCIKLNHYEQLDRSSLPCIQVAVLYTNIFGEGMIRVHTTQINIAKDIAELFRNVDLYSVLKFSICQVAYDMLNPMSEETIKESRDQLTDACCEILYTYRVECAESSSSTQLVLPECLKLLPLFTMSLLKHRIMRDETEPDARVAHLLISLCTPCHAAAPYVYPHMYPLHRLIGQDCTVNEATNQICWPKTCSLSKRLLEEDGLYLINTGMHIWLVVGESLSETVMNQVFTWDDKGTLFLVEDPPDDPDNYGWKVARMVDELRWNRPFFQPLRIVRRPKSSSSQVTTVEQRDMLSELLEDAKRTRGLARGQSQLEQQSYVDFLVYLHRRIQSKSFS